MNQRLKNESADVDQILECTDEDETTTKIAVMQIIIMLNLALVIMMIGQYYAK